MSLQEEIKRRSLHAKLPVRKPDGVKTADELYPDGYEVVQTDGIDIIIPLKKQITWKI